MLFPLCIAAALPAGMGTTYVQVLPSLCTCSVGILMVCFQLLSSILCERYSGDYDPSDDGELPTQACIVSNDDSESHSRSPLRGSASINQRTGGTGSLTRGPSTSESRRGGPSTSESRRGGDVGGRPSQSLELGLTPLLLPPTAATDHADPPA